jgi:GH24 family phage-related lysozyme (muramidase)
MPNSANIKEKIDERILRLLGLENEYELSYEEYIRHLKEAMVASRMFKSRYSTEESELITTEWKRIKGKSGRFKVKKISPKNFSSGRIFSIANKKVNFKKILPILSSKGGQITPLLSAGGNESSNYLSDINKSLDNIVAILSDSLKLQQKSEGDEKKRKEREKRSLVESGLEKGVSAIKKATDKVLAPVKSILDKIINYFMLMFLGKAIFKLIDWLGEKENREKLKSVFKFLGSHWPTFLALYLRFGTGLGRLVGTLTNIVIAGAIKLAAATAQLLASAGIKGFGGAAKFLNGRGGRLLSAGLQVTAAVGTTMAVNSGIEKLNSSGTESKQPKPKAPAYFGGGLANLKKLFGFIGGGSQNHSGPGAVSGQKGVDKIPAMLSDGEFVMSRGAVQKYGKNTLEGMNAAGGGTNKPRMISGTTYAAGGGAIGQAAEIIKKDEALSSLTPGQNDYVKPGGMSIGQSRTPWSKISPQTPIHAYPDSNGVPTIGWGATFYDGITNGLKRVKMGDSITKQKADGILSNNIQQLSSKYSRELGYWSKMSPSQQAGILSIGYNAGANSVVGGYPKLSAGLKSGNMTLAANNVYRSGPNAQRLAEEKRLLMSGPLDLTKVKAQPTQVQSSPPGFFERMLSTVGLGKTKKMKNGGYVEENTGMNIPGATADRQRVNLQPGEGVLTAKTVMSIGGERAVNYLNSLFDRNSDAARNGGRSNFATVARTLPNIVFPGPRQSRRSGDAQPIIMNQNAKSSGANMSQVAEQFIEQISASHPAGTASRQAILGLVG